MAPKVDDELKEEDEGEEELETLKHSGALVRHVPILRILAVVDQRIGCRLVGVPLGATFALIQGPLESVFVNIAAGVGAAVLRLGSVDDEVGEDETGRDHLDGGRVVEHIQMLLEGELEGDEGKIVARGIVRSIALRDADARVRADRVGWTSAPCQAPYARACSLAHSRVYPHVRASMGSSRHKRKRERPHLLVARFCLARRCCCGLAT